MGDTSGIISLGKHRLTTVTPAAHTSVALAYSCSPRMCASWEHTPGSPLRYLCVPTSHPCAFTGKGAPACSEAIDVGTIVTPKKSCLLSSPI